jgi:hypothetical protein
MLPAWATVAITLGGAALGALAGSVGAYFAFHGSQLNIQHVEREAWRTRLIDAAAGFEQAVSATITTLYIVIRDAKSGTLPTDATFEEIQNSLTKSAQTQSHFHLLFGDSEASTRALEMGSHIGNAWAELLSSRDLPDEARMDALDRASDLIAKADDTHDGFLQTAHVVVRPSKGSWPQPEQLG